MDDIAAPDHPHLNEVTGLHERVARLESEIDDLKKAGDKPDAPWFRNPSILLSLCALIFSFGTTVVSYVRTWQQEIHDSRTELRALIQRLDRIPVENIENAKKYADDPLTMQIMSSLLNSENALVAKQGADVIQKIPNHVGATEYYAVAAALVGSNLTAKALELYKAGLGVANDANDEIGILRSYGGLLFGTGDFENGRAQFESALSIFKKYPTSNQYLVESTHFQTEMAWAAAEAVARNCNKAKEHLDKADSHLANPQVAAQFKGQFDKARPNILNCTY